jgi:Integrase core domain.
MSNKLLGNDAIEEIRASMKNLRGSDAKQMAVRLAELYGVTWQHIYKITKDLRPAQKTRSDKGRRTWKLEEGTDVWKAAQLVIVDKLDPDQALLTCEVRGYTNLPKLATFRQLLREHGLGKEQRRLAKRPHRLWESEFPGEMYQIDVTALKVRWEDEKTRRILRIEGVDKNHPNPGENKIRVWQIMATDDHARRRFLRYVGTTHITSRIMVEFECELFSKWGIPRKLYTDNGAEFKGYHTRAEKILNKILENEGGYEHVKHAPGNSQASGKVEVAHKWAEKMDRYVGLAISEGQKVTIEDLNPFADEICRHYNEVHVHRVTGETPIKRWYSKHTVIRKLPEEIIQSALLSDEFEALLDASMTVAHKGVIYRVPGQQPFINYIGQKVTIVVPPNIDLLLIKLPSSEDFIEIEKVIATADKAGDYKSHAENTAQKLTKRLKETRKEDIKAIKAKNKQTGEIAPVPHFNVPIAIPETNVTHFPHPERVISVEEVAAVTPVPQSIYAKEISYWEAVAKFSDRFAHIDECKEFLSTIFGDGEVIAETDIEAAIENRHKQQRRDIYALCKL